MSERPGLRLTGSARMGLIATCLIGSLTLGSGSFVALAQDATPSATCTPNQMSADPVVATPIADAATSVESEEPAGAPADEATTTAALAVVDNLKACLADAASIATFVTANFIVESGFGSFDEAITAGMFDDLPFADLETGSVTTYDDGTIGVEVSYWNTEYQYVSDEWILVDEAGVWKIDSGNDLSVSIDGDTAVVGVTISADDTGAITIVPNAAAVVATDVVTLQATNTLDTDYAFYVVQLPEGSDPAGLLDGSVSDADISFIGWNDVDANGGLSEITLVALPAGVYVLVAVDQETGPIAVAPFEITAPAV